MSLKMPDDFENLTDIEYGYDGGDDSPSTGAIIGMGVGICVGIGVFFGGAGALYQWASRRGMDREFNQRYLARTGHLP